MKRKLKKTPIAEVAIIFIKHIARGNTEDQTQRFPKRHALFKVSVKLTTAYNTSKVLFLKQDNNKDNVIVETANITQAAINMYEKEA